LIAFHSYLKSTSRFCGEKVRELKEVRMRLGIREDGHVKLEGYFIARQR
jgi:hypothetical protein